MKELKNVIGSKEAAEELIIGKDTVYIHTNIRKLEPEEDDVKKEGDLYVYDEVQMSLPEYLKFQQKNIDLATRATTEMMTLIEVMGNNN